MALKQFRSKSEYSDSSLCYLISPRTEHPAVASKIKNLRATVEDYTAALPYRLVFLLRNIVLKNILSCVIHKGFALYLDTE